MKLSSIFGRNIGVSLLAALALSFLSAYSLPPSSYSPLAKNPAAARLEELSKGLSTVAKAVSPALVFVSVSAIPKSRSPGYINPFEDFFGIPSPQRQDRRPQRPVKRGIGSGYIIDLDKGLIATNNHVVEGADMISLKLANDETYEAKVLGTDPRTDVAVVEIKDKKFNRKGLSALPLGDSDEVEVGDFVVALGAPFELEASLSFGIVSAVKRDVQLDPSNTVLGSFIQTDAAINPGNSGGPLINMRGQVIGSNTAIFSKAGGYDGIGFAIPSNIVRRVAEEIINKGSVSRGFLGVIPQDIDPDIGQQLGLPSGMEGGALISRVEPGSAAEKGGIKANDVIVEIDGRKIASAYQLMSAIGLRAPNQKINVGLYREGKKVSLNVTIGTSPNENALARANNEQNRQPIWSNKGSKTDEFGIAVENLTSATKSKFSLTSDRGALITDVKPNTAAARSGLRPGDLILGVTINTRHFEIKSSNEYQSVTRGHDRILVRLEREGTFAYVGLKQ